MLSVRSFLCAIPKMETPSFQERQYQIFKKQTFLLLQKPNTGLDRESACPLQLHAANRSCCTAAYPGSTSRFSPWVGMTTCFWLSCPLKGITDLWHLGMQLYNSFNFRHEAATDGQIPYPIQYRPLNKILILSIYYVTMAEHKSYKVFSELFRMVHQLSIVLRCWMQHYSSWFMNMCAAHSSKLTDSCLPYTWCMECSQRNSRKM